ncbi:hypothetical protein [Flavobacterium sp.]|jgi:hypothetical protein|uniref:hypothetical protein n=1 Tax=Flavobacterium sp. TaxID=239 RepID=UPI0037BE71D2
MKKNTKQCKNPECKDDIIDYKSSKRIYCNDSCRNRAGYLKRLVENKEFDLVKKHTKLNYQALEKCIEKSAFEVDFKTLNILGFDINYLTNPKLYKIDNEVTSVYSIKEIQFYYNKTKEIITIIKQ